MEIELRAFSLSRLNITHSETNSIVTLSGERYAQLTKDSKVVIFFEGQVSELKAWFKWIATNGLQDKIPTRLKEILKETCIIEAHDCLAMTPMVKELFTILLQRYNVSDPPFPPNFTGYLFNLESYKDLPELTKNIVRTKLLYLCLENASNNGVFIT